MATALPYSSLIAPDSPAVSTPASVQETMPLLPLLLFVQLVKYTAPVDPSRPGAPTNTDHEPGEKPSATATAEPNASPEAASLALINALCVQGVSPLLDDTSHA